MALIRSNNGTYAGSVQADIFRDRGGDAVLKGLGGDDRFIMSGGGFDKAFGGGGNDRFVFSGEDQYGTFSGGTGADRYTIQDDFSGRIAVQYNEADGDKVNILKDGFVETTNRVGDTVYSWADGSKVTLVGSGASDDSMPSVPVANGRDWWIGTGGSDDIFGSRYDNYAGKGGLDYINGNDDANIIVAGNNNGVWDGTFGNTPGVNTAYIDAGGGSDDIYIAASKGAFDIRTGLSGADDVYVYGGNYVEINDMLDGATEGDSFHFGAKFRGDGDRASNDGQIWSFDSNDALVLHGDWAIEDFADFEATFENQDTGALILVRGFEVGVSDVEFIA